MVSEKLCGGNYYVNNYYMSDGTTDTNGNELQNGDAVFPIKDLKLKGTSKVLKRGDVLKGIRLTDNPKEIECRMGKTTMVLKTEFFKKKK